MCLFVRMHALVCVQIGGWVGGVVKCMGGGMGEDNVRCSCVCVVCECACVGPQVMTGPVCIYMNNNRHRLKSHEATCIADRHSCHAQH